MSHQQCTRLMIDLVVLMHNIEGSTHGVAHETCGHRVGSDAVDQKESTGVATGAIRIHRDGAIRGYLDATDVVHLENACSMLVSGDDIHAVANVGHGGRHRSRS